VKGRKQLNIAKKGRVMYHRKEKERVRLWKKTFIRLGEYTGESGALPISLPKESFVEQKRNMNMWHVLHALGSE